MSDKKFVGRVKVIQTQYGELTKIGISEKDFQENAVNGWLNLTLKESATKQGVKYLEVDTWKPSGQANTPAPAAKGISDDDMPF